PHDAASCPAGFQCFFYLTAFVCCSSQVRLECPSGGNAMTDARNNLIFCDISGRRGQICPSTYACLETGVGEVCCPKSHAGGGGNDGGGLNSEPNSNTEAK